MHRAVPRRDHDGVIHRLASLGTRGEHLRFAPGVAAVGAALHQHVHRRPVARVFARLGVGEQRPGGGGHDAGDAEVTVPLGARLPDDALPELVGGRVEGGGGRHRRTVGAVAVRIARLHLEEVGGALLEAGKGIGGRRAVHLPRQLPAGVKAVAVDRHPRGVPLDGNPVVKHLGDPQFLPLAPDRHRVRRHLVGEGHIFEERLGRPSGRALAPKLDQVAVLVLLQCDVALVVVVDVELGGGVVALLDLKAVDMPVVPRLKGIMAAPGAPAAAEAQFRLLDAEHEAVGIVDRDFAGEGALVRSHFARAELPHARLEFQHMLLRDCGLEADDRVRLVRAGQPERRPVGDLDRAA